MTPTRLSTIRPYIKSGQSGAVCSVGVSKSSVLKFKSLKNQNRYPSKNYKPKENASGKTRVNVLSLVMTGDVEFEVFYDAALFLNDVANNIADGNHADDSARIHDR